MNAKKREKTFNILTGIGIFIIAVPFFKYLKPLDVSGTLTKEGTTLAFQITGIDATILVVGVLVIFGAFLFKYRKLPWFN